MINVEEITKKYNNKVIGKEFNVHTVQVSQSVVEQLLKIHPEIKEFDEEKMLNFMASFFHEISLG